MLYSGSSADADTSTRIRWRTATPIPRAAPMRPPVRPALTCCRAAPSTSTAPLLGRLWASRRLRPELAAQPVVRQHAQTHGAQDGIHSPVELQQVVKQHAHDRHSQYVGQKQDGLVEA